MKVLILSASTGGGHNRASEALKEYIINQNSENSVQIIDALEQCSKLFNRTVTKGYKMLAMNAPELYGTFYRSADKDSPIGDLVTSVNSQFCKKLLPLIKNQNIDIVICCHPFASAMMSNLKEKYNINIPVIAIITDFMPHKAYIGKNINAFICASDSTSKQLVEKYKVEKNRVYAYGIPIFERFYNRDYNSDKDMNKTVAEHLGFDENKRTVLIMAGSFGVTDILKIYDHLVDIDYDYQIIVITGKNKKLYDAFEKMLNRDIREFETQEAPEWIEQLSDDNIIKLIYGQNEQFIQNIVKKFRRSNNKTKPTKLFYFIDNVEDYMHISDIIITKPGGLTTSESLACELPMAIFQAFPGQEAQNADFLIKNNMAIMLKKGREGAKQIEELLKNPQKLNEMKENCKKYSRKNSCEKIYSLMLKLLNK